MGKVKYYTKGKVNYYTMGKVKYYAIGKLKCYAMGKLKYFIKCRPVTIQDILKIPTTVFRWI
jgi:hypothetical protein